MVLPGEEALRMHTTLMLESIDVSRLSSNFQEYGRQELVETLRN
jgi:hypothetical protein